MESKLTKDQKQTFQKVIGDHHSIKVSVRFDDECGNGHNTFAITADEYEKGKWVSGGCQHELVAEHFPELAHLIKWHLVSTDGPMHYIANTTYHAKNGNLEYARSTAVWPDATLEQLQNTVALQLRLPELLAAFRADIEAMGFTW